MIHSCRPSQHKKKTAHSYKRNCAGYFSVRPELINSCGMRESVDLKLFCTLASFRVSNFRRRFHPLNPHFCRGKKIQFAYFLMLSNISKAQSVRRRTPRSLSLSVYYLDNTQQNVFTVNDHLFFLTLIRYIYNSLTIAYILMKNLF